VSRNNQIAHQLPSLLPSVHDTAFTLDLLDVNGNLSPTSLPIVFPVFSPVLYSQMLCETRVGPAARFCFRLLHQYSQKLYPNCHACLAARHVEKFREVTLLRPKVITANTLNFKPIFKMLSLFYKLFGTSVAGGVCLVCIFDGTAPLRAKIWSS